MSNPKPKTRAGQTAYDCAVAFMSLELAKRELDEISKAPIIEQSRLDALQLNLGRANAHCARLANGFDAAGGNG